MNAKITVETVPSQQAGSNDPWKEYSLVYVDVIDGLPPGNLHFHIMRIG